MAIPIKPVQLRPSEVKIVMEHAMRSNYSQAHWDAPAPQGWHADMQQIGLRLVGERTSSPGDHPHFQDKRVPAPERFLWDRIRQAYAVLRGRAYTRPLRQPR